MKARGLVLLLLFASPCVCLGYAIGDGTGDHLAHQWITHEGWRLFASQFGPTEVDAFLGEVREYPSGPNNSLIEGVYDEDIPGENPWNETGLDHPSLRHFWGHASDFSREFDDGLLFFDSAANRAVKYFTGGRDLLGELDADWGTAQESAPGEGIGNAYQQGNHDQAYYWLGHVAHLVQDVSLPAHSHADAHLEGFGALDDPDPVHDWVDGRDFSTAGSGSDARPAASFDDIEPRRYMQWQYLSSVGGVGREGNPGSVLAADLRSPAQMLDAAHNPSLLRPEIAASLEPMALSEAQPLYALVLELASNIDNYDSRDADGQLDDGMRRDGPGLFNLPGDYDDFTRDELNEVADVIVPRAMRATAELIRYFYSRVDDSPPVVKVAGTSADAERPTRIAIPASASAVQFVAAALAADPTSGVDLDGFEFLVERETDGGFETVLVTDPAAVLLTPLASGTYRVTATVENGGGLAGQSPAGYVEVLPRLTADFDGDADVDGDDLLRLLVGFGAASPVHANGDADRDGDVDRSDLFAWRAELGAITGLAAVLGARATVPEPTSLRLFAVAVLFALGRRLSRRR